MVGVHALFVIFETAVLVFVARMLEREALYMAELRQNDATERGRLLHLAQALERRDLTARVDAAGDGAAGALQDGIGQVAALVRSIQGTVDVVSHASREVTDASRQSERVSEEIAHAIASWLEAPSARPRSSATRAPPPRPSRTACTATPSAPATPPMPSSRPARWPRPASSTPTPPRPP